MSRMKTRTLTSALLVLSAIATSPLFGAWWCGGGCGGCSAWYPMIPQAAQELKNAYLDTETRLSNKYNTVIVPLLDERKELLQTKSRLLLELEALNRLTATSVKKIKHEQRNTK